MNLHLLTWLDWAVLTVLQAGLYWWAISRCQKQYAADLLAQQAKDHERNEANDKALRAYFAREGGRGK